MSTIKELEAQLRAEQMKIKLFGLKGKSVALNSVSKIKKAVKKPVSKLQRLASLLLLS